MGELDAGNTGDPGHTNAKVGGGTLNSEHRSSSSNSSSSSWRSWKQWAVVLIAAATITAALALTAASSLRAKEVSPRGGGEQATETASAPPPLRLLAASRESPSVVRLVLNSGEQVRIDTGSVELRAANGQLLQQLLLSPLSAFYQGAAQLRQQQQQQQQVEALQQQRRSLLSMHFQLQHLQTQAAALQAATATLQQQQQREQEQGEERARRRLQVFRQAPSQAVPTSPSSSYASLMPHALSSSSSNNSGSSSSDSADQMPSGGKASEPQSGEVCSAAIDGQQHAACTNLADNSSNNSSSGRKGTERGSRLFITRLARGGDGEKEPLPQLPVHPSAALQQQQQDVLASPQRKLLASQALGGVALVADAISRVGQAMLAAPMSYAATVDAAAALFSSPMAPVVSAPLHVSGVNPYTTAYIPYIAEPYAALGCGPLDPNCLYTGVY
ncbi:hypothetical protein Esti_002659 [Eimeria stiedai]